MSARTYRRRGWARAKRALDLAVVELGLARPEVGRVRRVAAGLSRAAYAAEVDADDEGWPRVLAALVPHAEVAEHATLDARGEVALLRLLAERELGFRVPRLALCVEAGSETILVRDWVAGFPATLRADRSPLVRPWDLVADVAAKVHRVSLGGDGGPFAWLRGHPTRRAHGEALVEAHAPLTEAPDRQPLAALAWLRENLPPAEPARLLHGDLLGQNILLDLDGPPAVVDWECAMRGDPARDLALVTRGVRRPFGIPTGMRELLEAYAERADDEVTERQVRFHEIELHVGWYRLALAGEPDAPALDSVLGRLRNLVRWVGA